MKTGHLIDLEELILTCRDDKARELIQEAHTCYRTGAYRSSIIATWVAVVYDLIEKLRELALGGDAPAQSLINNLDNWHKVRNTPELLDFEKKILSICTQSFEFFHPIEEKYLNRIFEDRNLCANPNLAKHGELFAVGAELARLHLRNAIEIVLSQPATVGKAALTELFELIKTASFPTTREKIRLVLMASPLERPRPNLFDPFILGLTCVVNTGQIKSSELYLRINIIGAAFDLNPDLAARLVRGSLKKMLSTKTKEEGLKWVLVLVCEVEQIQEAVEEGLRSRLERFLDEAESYDIAMCAAGCLRANFFAEKMETKVKLMDDDDLSVVVRKSNGPMPDMVIKRGFELLEKAGSWPRASDICNRIFAPIAEDLTFPQIEQLFQHADKNEQIPPAWGFSSLIQKLRELPHLKGEKIDIALKKHEWSAKYFE